jgi:hypothetical protein
MGHTICIIGFVQRQICASSFFATPASHPEVFGYLRLDQPHFKWSPEMHLGQKKWMQSLEWAAVDRRIADQSIRLAGGPLRPISRLI